MARLNYNKTITERGKTGAYLKKMLFLPSSSGEQICLIFAKVLLLFLVISLFLGSEKDLSKICLMDRLPRRKGERRSKHWSIRPVHVAFSRVAFGQIQQHYQPNLVVRKLRKLQIKLFSFILMLKYLIPLLISSVGRTHQAESVPVGKVNYYKGKNTYHLSGIRLFSLIVGN